MARYERKYPPGEGARRGVRDGFDQSGGVICKGCFQKKLEIDRLRAEIAQLKKRLNCQERRAKDGFFGKDTPSSKIPIKANSPEESRAKRGGAKPGHKGHGRKAASVSTADRVVEVPLPDECPDCHLTLLPKDIAERTVVDAFNAQAQRCLFRLRRGECPGCLKTVKSSLPVLPKSLYSNRLIAQAAAMHYVHGLPLGKVVSILGPNVSEGGLMAAFHRLSLMAKDSVSQLINDFRNSPVRHADESGWRIDGKSGYVWLFASQSTSIFRFADSRASRVVHDVLGGEQLSGVLVVDRYSGYNRVPCALQYCFAHLLRDVEKLVDESPDVPEVQCFVAEFAPLLADAMTLRSQPIDNSVYECKATDLKARIMASAIRDASHEGIRQIQRIFIEKKSRLFHWVTDRRIPAENNLAERELRPSVIARKVSFGSQSAKGAETRGNLMSLLHTVRKRVKDRPPEEWLKEQLDRLVACPAIERRLAAPILESSPDH